MHSEERDRRRIAVKTTLRVDQVTGEVAGALQEYGVRAVLLKGPSIARWLYDDHGLRTYGDTDLLVSPGELTQAQEVLARCGFRPGQAGWRFVSRNWNRPPDAVDLHRSLVGVGAEDADAWLLLSSDTEKLIVGGVEVDVLGASARCRTQLGCSAR